MPQSVYTTGAQTGTNIQSKQVAIVQQQLSGENQGCVTPYRYEKEIFSSSKILRETKTFRMG